MSSIKIAFILVFLLSSCGYNTEKQYVFFLHNKFIEEHPINAEHPIHGRAEYNEILQALQNEGFTVISEKRKANTPVEDYAHYVSVEIRALLQQGVKSNNITIVGTSKGGQIAQHISSILGNKDIKYVFIGSAFSSDSDKYQKLNICGNILSIREKSDKGAISIEQKVKQSSCFPMNYQDIEINTGMGHGFLFKLKNEWFLPTVNWIKNNP